MFPSHCIVKGYTIFICQPLLGSPNVTSLVYDNELRTFTCNSTGGPATTITWRKNGAVITPNATYQHTKRIVDSVEGNYQTVLTIDPSADQGSIVGSYCCTVENVRGKSSMMVVIGKLTICIHPC